MVSINIYETFNSWINIANIPSKWNTYHPFQTTIRKLRFQWGRGRKNVFQTHGKSDRIDTDRNFSFFSQQIAKYRIVVGAAIKTSYSNIEMRLEMSDISVQLRYWKLLTTHHSNRCEKKYSYATLLPSPRLSLLSAKNFSAQFT